MGRLPTSLLTLATLAACLPHEGRAFIASSSTRNSMLCRKNRRCPMLAASNNLRRCSNQQKMLGVVMIASREGAVESLRKTRRGRGGFVRLGASAAAGLGYEASGVSGDSGGCNRVDGELQREPNIKGQMMEILRPDLPRVSDNFFLGTRALLLYTTYDVVAHVDLCAYHQPHPLSPTSLCV